jgi:site-specific DNA-methyltransferase (adenine-specific)
MTLITIGKHEIHVEDCIDAMAKLPDRSIDIIITSPPYNLGKAYNTYDDKLPRDQYLSWMKSVAGHCSRILKEDGSFFLNIGSTNIDPWLSFDVASMFRGPLVLQNHIVWAKSISITEETYGHFKPITSKRFLNQNHEAIFHFTVQGDVPVDRLAIGVPYMDKSNIKRRGHAQDRRCRGNTWFIPYETAQSKSDKYDHPAGFPLELPTRCIQLTGKKEAVVLDPFMGTGTTILAAHKLGHKGIGIDIDPVYAGVAQNRLLAQIQRELSDENDGR